MDIHARVPKHVQGLFCSNYNIWKKTADKDLDALIILEDDAVLAPNWTQEVNDLIKSQCSPWDYLAVDTFLAHPAPVIEDKCDNFHQRGTGWGTAMQILRVANLKTLIHNAENNGMDAMDHWFNFQNNCENAYVWKPKIVSPWSMKSERFNDSEWLPDACNKNSLRYSDIGFIFHDNVANFECASAQE